MVLGASFDSVEENRAFAEKFDFPYPLLCDTTKAMGIAYGAAADEGSKYPERITYVIGPDGKIEYAERVRDIEQHVPTAWSRLIDL